MTTWHNKSSVPDSVQYLFIKLGGFGKFAGGAVLKARAITGRAQFSHKRLEKAIDTVVAAFPLDEDDQAKRGDAVLVKKSQGQMYLCLHFRRYVMLMVSRFVCATLADKGESILLRNYDPPFALLPVSTGAKDLDFDAITIKEAARATSAAPTYLKEVTVQNLKFWDGGLLNNNPINQVWDNRFDLIPSLDASPRITCIVSLGTTHKDYDLVGRRPGSGIARLFNTLSKTASFLTNTEAKHRDFDRNVRQHNMRVPRRQTGYYRFNAPTGKESIGLDDYWKMPKLVEYTNVYLEMPVVDAWINECASLLAKQQL